MKEFFWFILIATPFCLLLGYNLETLSMQNWECTQWSEWVEQVIDETEMERECLQWSRIKND